MSNREENYSQKEVPYSIRRTWGEKPLAEGVFQMMQEVQFIHVMKGNKKLQVREESVVVREGDGLFLNAHVPYKCDQEGIDQITVCFHPELLCANEYIEKKFISPLINDESLPYLVLHQNISWQNDILEYIQELYMYESAGAEDMPLLAQHCFYGIWHALYSHVPHADEIVYEDEHLFSMKKMLTYIEDHYPEEITLKDIADAGGVSETACNQLFTKMVYDSPYRYLISYRLQQAKILLYETDSQITEIALQCGFSDPSYFTKMFREAFQETPGAYRKRHRERSL